MEIQYKDTHLGPSPSSTCSQTNFFTLSREIRDSIYELALLSSSPIIAWCGMPLEDLELWQHNSSTAKVPIPLDEYKSHTLSIEQLVPNLLRCNGTVAREAALAFYSKNTFRFLGDWTWDTVVSWLEAIGERNRGYLTSIEVTMRKPPHVWQHPDCTRTEVREFGEPPREKAFPRSPHLHRSADSTTEGVVENLNPAVETAFALLGGPVDRLKLTLNVLLGGSLLPGLQLSMDEQHPYSNYFSMDLPNLMEKLRVLHTTEAGMNDNIEIIWKGMTWKRAFLDERQDIEERGWEILDTKEEERERPSRPGKPPGGPPFQFVWFTIRRKELVGPLMAEDPSPHSWLGF